MSTTFSADRIEEPKADEVIEEVKKPEGEEEEAAAPEEPAEGEPVKQKWKSNNFRWTVTNGKPKNLPQLFRDYMGNRASFEEKNWKATGATSHGDAAVKALDEFCDRVSSESGATTVYQQVVFNDLE